MEILDWTTFFKIPNTQGILKIKYRYFWFFFDFFETEHTSWERSEQIERQYPGIIKIFVSRSCEMILKVVGAMAKKCSDCVKKYIPRRRVFSDF